MTKTIIINLTQHNATAEQTAAGVIDLPQEKQKRLKELLTFTTPPTERDMDERARQIVVLAKPFLTAMIGGAPYFMPVLQKRLKDEGIRVLYSFTQRVATEATMRDGTVQKVVAFRHCAFVEA